MYRVLRYGGTAVIQDMSREATRDDIDREVHRMRLGVLVLVEDAAEPITAVHPKTCDLGRIGDRLGQWAQRPGVGQPSMGSMAIVELFVLAQRS
ncbi:MAG TPA: hypothetical protein VFB74_35985 [Kribbellaceae bacterium]|nr:hypothetical protein [Kribbellaceae bacterium]